MAYFTPTSINVQTSLTNNLITIAATDGTTFITFEAINHSSQVKEMLILAGQALASAGSPNASGPLLIEYETVGSANHFKGVIAPLA